MTDFQTPPDHAVRVAALYRFAPIADPAAVRDALQVVCDAGEVGTLLVAPEGLNGTIAGSEAADRGGAVDDPRHAGVRDAGASNTPGQTPCRSIGMKVRVKREIVTMGQPRSGPAATGGHLCLARGLERADRRSRTPSSSTRATTMRPRSAAFAGAVEPNTAQLPRFSRLVPHRGPRPADSRRKPQVAMYLHRRHPLRKIHRLS